MSDLGPARTRVESKDTLATAHAQTLHFGWAYIRVKKPLCKNFEAKEGMGGYSRWAYFREGTVLSAIMLLL